MPRALLIVLDSVGIGGAADAAKFGDEGSDTLGHIYDSVAGLSLPALDSIGLGRAYHRNPDPAGLLNGCSYGWMSERSEGKDTTTGHWEIAGAVLEEAFGVFEAFPPELLSAIEQDAGVGFIGNYPQSGTVILEELGAEHVATGQPIVYTSADSVLQIAAHEEVVPLQTLYAICEAARRHCDAYRIGRVIARPFTGKSGAFERTPNRRDYSLQPPETVLNRLQDAKVQVTGIGKISDIFASSGIDHSYPTKSNAAGMAAMDELWADTEGLLFANLVDFDMLYGHRRDPAGYADCLCEFDQWLQSFLREIKPTDLVMITADHGNDPTWSGTDHTREQVPLLCLYGSAPAACSGHHPSFAAVADQLERFFKI